MSSLALRKTDLEESYRAAGSAVFYHPLRHDRMSGVIVETYKKRTIRRQTNGHDLLAKEEICCAMATD